MRMWSPGKLCMGDEGRVSIGYEREKKNMCVTSEWQVREVKIRCGERVRR